MDARRQCAEASRRASEYLDGALAPGDRRDFDRHLAACPGCAHEFHTLRETLQRLRSLPRDSMPTPMKERLRQALHSRRSA